MFNVLLTLSSSKGEKLIFFNIQFFLDTLLYILLAITLLLFFGLVWVHEKGSANKNRNALDHFFFS